MTSAPRLSYLHNIGKDPLKALTIGYLLEITADKYPNREAIVSVQQNQRLTYQELLTAADKFAAGLNVLGVKKGDRLGIWGPNLVEWYVTYLACARAGVLMVAINPGSQAQEIEFCINKVGIKIIVCPYKGKYQNYYDILSEIVPELKSVETKKLANNKVPSLEGIVIISEEKLSGTFQYKEVLEYANETQISRIQNIQHLIQPDDACLIQFSSGTTGQPKAAVVSHFQVVNGGYEIGKRSGLNEKHHKICVQVPFFHVFGTTVSLISALNFGSTIVVGSPTYNAQENLKAIKSEGCTSVYGTPTMFIDLISAQAQLKLDISIDFALTGGAPCSPETFKQIRQVLNAKKVKSIYGLTEVNAVAFQSFPSDAEEFKLDLTVGYLADHLEAKVVDEDDNILPVSTPGELCIRGYCVMLGYWGEEDKTKEVISADGWFRTGDKFVLQDDGYGMNIGRLRDMIIRGGENIYPTEVEDILDTHPNILESQVIGLRHPRLGEEVCACVRLRTGATLTHESLSAFCKGKIPFSKIPSQLRIVKEFPKTTSGKIKKYQLVKQFQQVM